METAADRSHQSQVIEWLNMSYDGVREAHQFANPFCTVDAVVMDKGVPSAFFEIRGRWIDYETFRSQGMVGFIPLDKWLALREMSRHTGLKCGYAFSLRGDKEDEKNTGSPVAIFVALLFEGGGRIARPVTFNHQPYVRSSDKATGEVKFYEQDRIY